MKNIYSVLGKNLFLLFILIFGNIGNIYSITSIQSGNWSSTSTWDSGTIPLSGSNVIINHDVNVDIAANCKNLTINSGATLTINDNQSIYPRAVFTVSSGAFFNSGGSTTLVVDGTFNFNSTSFNSGSNMTLNISNFNIASGSIFTIGTYANINFSIYSIIDGTLNIGSSSTIIFNNIDINGTLSLGDNCPVSIPSLKEFIIYSGGTVITKENVISGAGAFTNDISGILKIGSPNGISSSGATGNIQTATRNYGATATYIYNGSIAQVTGNGLPTLAGTTGKLIIDNPTGVTLSANYINNSSHTSGITVNSGAVLDLDTYNISGTGYFTNNGTIKTKKTNGLDGALTISNITLSSGICVFNYSGAQTTGTSIPTVGGLAVSGGSQLTLDNTSLTCGTLSIESGSKLSIASTQTLTSTTNNGVTLNGTECLVLQTGTGTTPRSASFISTGTIGGTGSAKIECYFTGTNDGSANKIPNGRWWFLSSPFSGALNTVIQTDKDEPRWSTNTVISEYDNIVKFWNLSLRNWTIKATSVLTVSLNHGGTGAGFIVRADADYTKNFSGIPNSGDITTASFSGYTSSTSNSMDGYFLLGNPYPSYFNVKRMLRNNIASMEQSFYIRVVDPNDASKMVTDTYNAAIQNSNSGTSNSLLALDSLIAPMQSVWVRARQDQGITNLLLSNSLRSNNIGGAATFRKSSRNTSDQNTSVDILRIKLIGIKSSDQNVIAFIDGAKNSIDDYDSFKMFDEANSAYFYSVLPTGENLVFNSFTPDTLLHSQPLVVRPFKNGTYKFTIEATQFPEKYAVQLVDLKLKKYVDLRTVDYSFVADSITSDSMTIRNRFVLNVKNGKIADLIFTSIKHFEQNFVQTNIYNVGNVLYVKNAPIGSNLTIFDCMGRIYSKKSILNETETILLQNNCYIAKLIGSGEIVTKKIIINSER